MAVAHLRGLFHFFRKFRNEGIDKLFVNAKHKAEQLGIPTT